MFKDGFVASIRVNGENLRELNKTVFLPLNSTYEIYLKNTTNKTACVTISVDDREVISDLIVYPKSSEIISRFYEGNANSGHSLKFIKMTDKIAQHRGTTPFDGILKISWVYESDVKVVPTYIPYNPPVWREFNPNPYPYTNPITWTSTTSTTTYGYEDNDTTPSAYYLNAASTASSNFSRRATMSKGITSSNACRGIDGITVNGAPVNQQISTVNNHWTWEYNEHVIELFLQGKEKKITTKIKIHCSICGTNVNIKQGLYCPCCGTYLK